MLSKQNIRIMLIMLSMVNLVEFNPVWAADSYCSTSSFLNNIFNRVKYRFGVLPSDIQVVGKSAYPNDLKVWKKSLSSGEVTVSEVYDSKGVLLASSDLGTSSHYTKVNGDVVQDSYIQALTNAHKECADLSGCTLRLVHTHPPDPLGEDLHFSPSDIRASYHMKAMIEAMGFEKMNIQMDVIVSDRGGGIELLSYTLPSYFSLKNGKYFPGTKLLNSITKKPEIFKNAGNHIKERHKLINNVMDKELGISTLKDSSPSKFSSLFPMLDQKKKSMIAITESSDTLFQNAEFGLLDEKMSTIAELSVALMSPEQFLPTLQKLNESEKGLRIFVYGEGFKNQNLVLESVFDLRAVLNKVGFKKPLTINYYSNGAFKELTLAVDGNIRNGNKIISSKGQLLEDKIDFSIDDLGSH